MGVFFGFCNAQLLEAEAGNIFAKAVADRARREGRGQMEVFAIAA
jgi:hypothetical protein